MQSGLWTEQRKRKKSSGYVQHMAAEASLRCTKVYDWDRYSYTDVEQKLDFDEVLQACMFVLILDLVEDFHTVEERRLHRIFCGLKIYAGHLQVALHRTNG